MAAGCCSSTGIRFGLLKASGLSRFIFLNTNEVQKLADTEIKGELGAEIKKAFIFACYTGLRISDIRGLKWGDIERDPIRIIKRQKKTQRAVYVPLNNIAWNIIESLSDFLCNWQSIIRTEPVLSLVSMALPVKRQAPVPNRHRPFL
ncbi:MAG: tyrosine-type recombinase/integrase [Treponema sp.]|jgi:integrase|nr:tyrosine-type recombinase/integrase [Treponema sp.]